MPIILEKAGDIPVELHSHCTTGLAPLVYAEALKQASRHCIVVSRRWPTVRRSRPLLDMISNARLMGYSIDLDEQLLRVGFKAPLFDRATGPQAAG